MATRAEYRGIGIFGNKNVAPDIETLELGVAITWLTAVVNLIDRSTENRAPNRCLPFDGIGARHSG